ncbi:MAG: nicotinate (nicotinamide) nucleotide adenylyltransferase [Ruminococcus sp.]|nr:nicotinate (nicotinamide) nucleotide adenylyltransferase [Ruminococcus sp.]
MRIGIYGGSFNPVHNGHIHLARAAAEEFRLDRVYLVPSRISPHRSSAEYVSGEDRLEMLRLACKGDGILDVSSYELDSDRVSYTIYTIRYFRSIFPDDELFLLVGSDMLMCFEKWYRFEDILSEVTLCVVSRNEGDLPQLEEKADKLRKFGNICISRAQPLEVSSTEIRKKIEKNENYACYLDENVVQYIRLKGLYSLRGENKFAL